MTVMHLFGGVEPVNSLHTLGNVNLLPGHIPGHLPSTERILGYIPRTGTNIPSAKIQTSKTLTCIILLMKTENS